MHLVRAIHGIVHVDELELVSISSTLLDSCRCGVNHLPIEHQELMFWVQLLSLPTRNVLRLARLWLDTR